MIAPSTRRLLTIPLIWAAAGGALWFFVADPYQANLVKRRVAVNTNAALQTRPEEQAAVMARRNLEDLRPWVGRSTDPKIYVLAAANSRLLRQYDQAIRAYNFALYYEPTPYLYLNRGVTELAAGRLDAARSSFARAVQFDRTLIPAVAEAEAVYRYLHPDK